jgi:hypothetical protein
MYFLATSSLYPVAAAHGPSGHHVVDYIWTRREFKKAIARAARHTLDFNIVQVVELGDYTTCVFKTVFLRLFQRRVKQRLKRI